MSERVSAIIIDTEWGYSNGRIGCESAFIPVVLCVLIVPSGQELVFLPGKDDEQLLDFLTEHKQSLFVAHSATAEMKYLLRKKLPTPERWFDTLLAERWLVNSPTRPGVSLAKSLERHGLSKLIPAEKDDSRQQILNLAFDAADSNAMSDISEYCLQDCRATLALFQRQRSVKNNATQLDKLMDWWSVYLLTIAKMELRGIPFDMEIYKKLTDHWPEIRKKLADEINVVAPLMAPSGLERAAFMKFCIEMGIPLPRLYDKRTHKFRFSIANEALKEIEHHHPSIPKIRETQKTLVALKNNNMVVDVATGRHHFSVMPFGTVTGRNAPIQFIFSQAKWMRWLMVPESPNHIFAYIDFKAQEIGVAAALSQDLNMKTMYQAEDPHIAFAVLAGAVQMGQKRGLSRS